MAGLPAEGEMMTGGIAKVPPANRSWLARWRGFRDRLLVNPAFQRAAIALPFTRPIARRRTQALFDLCAGFVYSQILHANVTLGLCPLLAEGPASLAELARRLSLPLASVARLLDASVALGLAERRGGRFGLGPLGAALIANPGVAAMVEHHRALYADLADPVALLAARPKDTALARYWPYAGMAPDARALGIEQVEAYSAVMAASQPMIAEEVLAAYRFSRHRCLLDVGGGSGAFLLAAARRVPTLRLMLYDLPAVATMARAKLAAAGLGQKVLISGGDFFADPLPQGADVITLIRVLHDHDDRAVFKILRATRAALPAGGRVVIAEPMVGTAGGDRVSDAYFGFYLLAMGQGRPRSPAAYTELLAAAGFHAAKLLRTRLDMLARVIVASV